jgi:hypothetical protein
MEERLVELLAASLAIGIFIGVAHFVAERRAQSMPIILGMERPGRRLI